MKTLALAFLAALALSSTSVSHAAEVKVLTAGAMQDVVTAVARDFERQTGHRVTIAYDTVGALSNRIQAGETFDVAVLTPAALEDLTAKARTVRDGRTNLAQVGMGVMVKEGAPVPDIATVASFQRALLAAPTVGYIDPAAGGSSGIYFNGLIDRMGIGREIRAKARLKQGGAVAELVASGEAAIGIHQISEIVGYPGIRLIGPLPSEIQNYTIYAAAVGAMAKESAAAQALIRALAAPQAGEIYRNRGMEPVR